MISTRRAECKRSTTRGFAVATYFRRMLELSARLKVHGWEERKIEEIVDLVLAPCGLVLLCRRQTQKDDEALSRHAWVQSVMHGERHYSSTPEPLAHLQKVVPAGIA
jgi:hypothetical protein